MKPTRDELRAEPSLCASWAEGSADDLAVVVGGEHRDVKPANVVLPVPWTAVCILSS